MCGVGLPQLPACRCTAVSRPLTVLNEQHDETHACMVHTGLREGSRLRLLGVLHEQHEEHDDTMVHTAGEKSADCDGDWVYPAYCTSYTST